VEESGLKKSFAVVLKKYDGSKDKKAFYVPSETDDFANFQK
jgi:hypothetical protein